MTSLPPLKALKAFEAAARHRSFSKAANELCVTHSAVSHQIKKLEGWMGLQLFVRTAHGVAPTPDGHEFALLVRDCFGRMVDASDRLRRLGGARTVRVATIPSVATRWVIPRLPAFQEAFPQIDLVVSYAPTIFSDSLSGFDVLITYFDGTYQGNLESTVLFSGAVRPVCSPSYLKAHRPITELSDLANVTFLHDEDRSTWIAWLLSRGIDTAKAQSGTLFADFNLLSTAAIAGHGVALCSTDLIRHDLAAGHLVQLFDGAIFTDRNYVLFKRRSSTIAVHQFCTWLVVETGS